MDVLLLSVELKVLAVDEGTDGGDGWYACIGKKSDINSIQCILYNKP